MLLLQSESITEQNVDINVLESGGLVKPEEMIVDKAILNRDLISLHHLSMM